MVSFSSEDSSNAFLGGIFNLTRGISSSDSEWDDDDEEEEEEEEDSRHFACEKLQ